MATRVHRSTDSSRQAEQHGSQHTLWLTAALCLALCSLSACASSTRPTTQPIHHQTVQTKSGTIISYSTQPQDVLLRLFFGGGKVGSVQFTPEISVYGNGTFIIGPGLQPQQGSLSNSSLQTLLQTLIDTDKLLTLHQQVFDDIPDQNATLLQVALNNKSYQFTYGPFDNLQESAQALQEYQQLGNALSTIRNALNGSTHSYTSQTQALLVYQTSRLDFTATQNASIPFWSLTTLDLANASAYECGLITPDPNNPRPNLDNGCLTYTVPLHVVQLSRSDTQNIARLLHGQQQRLFRTYTAYYVVMLRPLLPDELASKQVAMYGSDLQTYTPIPLQTGAIPIASATPA